MCDHHYAQVHFLSGAGSMAARSWQLRLLAVSVLAWIAAPLVDSTLQTCPLCPFGTACPYRSPTSTPRPDPGQVFAGPTGVTSITMYKYNTAGTSPAYYNWYVSLPALCPHSSQPWPPSSLFPLLAALASLLSVPS